MSKYAKSNTQLFRNQFSSLIQVLNLQELYDVITSKGFTNWWKNLFSKSSESIASLRYYPIARNKLLNKGITSEDYANAIIGGSTWEISNRYFLGHNRTFEVGRYKFDNPSSFTDFEPYSQCQLYLPYIGYIDLPLNEILGKQIRVWYDIDFSTGMATAYVNGQYDKGSSHPQYLLAQKSAKIGIDVPWGSTNSAENTRNVVSTAIATAVEIASIVATKGASEFLTATKGIATGVALSKATLSITNSMQLKYARGGACGSLSNLVMPNEPFILIKKQKLVDIDEEDFAHQYGKPLYQSRTLSSLRGYTIVDDIHLENLPNATRDEYMEIEQLLKTGVHL